MSEKQRVMKRILVANRGEIACRIIRSIQELGLTAIAVYSDADADAPHVHDAAESCYLGDSESAQSYLNIDKIIETAVSAQIDAIHPGYGFLSENAEFAQRVLDANIQWIGPSPAAIALMGEKSQAKEQAKIAGVPILEGVKIDENLSQEERLNLIREVGFPLLIKATYGGGGRGIRLVEKEEEFEDSLKTAQSEAKNAFGSVEVMVERYVTGARHIEIQVLADNHGNAVHLFERECSVQRRRQKVVEEAPSSSLSAQTRQKMGETALKLVRQIGYVSAGTIEFLVDSEERFYFLEMNTRLQVEHTVTEEITGVDLVEWQLKIARGEALDFRQEELMIWGHSIQARLYAENPYRGFLPQSGNIHQFSLPETAERYDHGLHVWNENGVDEPRKQNISTYYDPMIAKIISHGETREIAIDQLHQALSKLRCFGIQTNQSYLQQILEHPDFRAGAIDITWLEQQAWEKPSLGNTELMTAALLFAFKDQNQAASLDLFFSRGTFLIEQKLQIQEADESEEYIAHLQPKIQENHRLQRNCFEISIDGSDAGNIQIIALSSSQITAVQDGLRQTMDYHFDDSGLWLLSAGKTYFIQEPSPFISSQQEEDSLDILASMLGKVVAVHVQAGENVQKGAKICTIEAMKMEHQMCAKSDGQLQELLINIGDQVKAGQLLGRLAEV